MNNDQITLNDEILWEYLSINGRNQVGGNFEDRFSSINPFNLRTTVL